MRITIKLTSLLLTTTLLFFTMSTHAKDGLITVASPFSVNETADRFEQSVKDKGLAFFTRINHSQNAQKAELDLRPTQIILFGNPKAGTPLMQCAPTIAIDLPQKALFWEDENGASWLSYNDPAYLKQRHNIEGCDPVLDKITGLLKALANAATQQGE